MKPIEKAARMYIKALNEPANAWGVHYLDGRPTDEFVLVCVETYGRKAWWDSVGDAIAEEKATGAD